MVDAHTHLTDLAWGWDANAVASLPDKLEKFISSGPGREVELFIQGGVDPEEWDRQQILANRFPRRIGQVYGYHPWWVANLSDRTPAFRQRALQLLETRLNQTVGLGEIGLDFGKKQDPGTFPTQNEWFSEQMDLAEKTKKPVVLHVVHAHPQALDVLKNYSVRGLVHAFSQDWSITKRYLSLGYVVSVGARGLDTRSEGLQRTLREIPLDHLVFETDATGDTQALHLLAQHLVSLRGGSKEQLYEIQRQTIKNLFGI